MRKLAPVLHERLVVLIHSMGYELIGYELLPQGRQLLFRLYVDGREGKGVSVDDCSKVSRQVSAMLDVDEPFQARYVLEVSSPGIDRPLFDLAHYRQCVGKKVKIRLHEAINQRRQFKGLLVSVEGEQIDLMVETTGETLKVPFSQIEKGNLIGDIDFEGQKPEVKNQGPN